MRQRIMMVGLAATLALGATAEGPARRPASGEPAPPPPPKPRPPVSTGVARVLRQPYDDPKPPGHNGARAMARRVRQMQRAAEKAARRGQP